MQNQHRQTPAEEHFEAALRHCFPDVEVGVYLGFFGVNLRVRSVAILLYPAIDSALLSSELPMTRYLQALGLTVLRFTNQEALFHTGASLWKVSCALRRKGELKKSEKRLVRQARLLFNWDHRDELMATLAKAKVESGAKSGR